jgi:DNA-binding NtrC family response regulator
MATVLLLEDDRGMRRFLALALRNAGYSVVDTGDADDALEMLSGEARFDLLIADVRMPLFKPHGIDVGKVGVYKRPTLKVIYISGGEVPEGFIDQTKTPLLHKPIRQDALLAAVAAALARRYD